MTLVAVDIGNSAFKAGWFSPTALAAEFPATDVIWSCRDEAPDASLTAFLPESPVQWRVASVNRTRQENLAAWVREHRPQDDYRLLTYRELPLTVEVEFPERVGVDRLAAAVAGNALRSPSSPAIVVDAGSAITVDLVSATGAFQGGAIYPGFRLSAEALFGGADLLPLTILEPLREPPPVVGRNTDAAIKSGLFWGAVGAVRELVARTAESVRPAPEVFVTGGDLRRLAEFIPGSRFAPNMVLSGIALATRSAG